MAFDGLFIPKRIRLFPADFRTQVIRCPDSSHSKAIVVIDNTRNAEVSELDDIINCDENVLCFQIWNEGIFCLIDVKR